jgi:hypothetical protein
MLVAGNVMGSLYKRKPRMIAAVIAGRKRLAFDGSHFMFLRVNAVMYNLVNP